MTTCNYAGNRFDIIIPTYDTASVQANEGFCFLCIIDILTYKTALNLEVRELPPASAQEVLLKVLFNLCHYTEVILNCGLAKTKPGRQKYAKSTTKS